MKNMKVVPNRDLSDDEKKVRETTNWLYTMGYEQWPSEYEAIARSREHPAAPMVTIVSDYKEVTTATVEWELGGLRHQSIGSARKHPRDEFDWEVGVSLALSRALRTAARSAGDYARNRGMVLGLGDVFKEEDR